MKIFKSPLRFPGGKSRAIKFLEPHLIEATEFRETFFGGGSVSIFAAQVKGYQRMLANDLNYEAYCFWEQLKTNGAELIAAIHNIKENSEDGRQLYLEIVARRESSLSDFERARDFFILNRITFSGLVDAGGYSDQSFHKRFTKSSIKRLYGLPELLKKIEFSCDDYQELVLKEGSDVLLYLDPPYYSATKSRLYGKEGILHLQFDHQRLFDTLKLCPHKWIMSYDNSEFVQDLYKDYEKIEWNLSYGMNNVGKKTIAIGKELLIKNF